MTKPLPDPGTPEWDALKKAIDDAHRRAMADMEAYRLASIPSREQMQQVIGPRGGCWPHQMR